MKLFKAKIYHKRLSPTVNSFVYGGFYLTLDVDKDYDSSLSLFSFERFNLFSFYKNDHGFRDGSSLRDWCQSILNSVDPGFNPIRIILQTFPRVLGYVFNPVSFYFCHGESDQVIYVICEVNNTFGESHNYIVKGQDAPFLLPKKFHVSPFYKVEGEYRFSFKPGLASIDYSISGEKSLETSIVGSEVPATSLEILKLFFRYPLYTISIVILIHYQALKLFIKGVTFYHKPSKPKKGVTYEHND